MASSKKFPRILNYKNLDFEKIEYYQPQRSNDGCLISTVYYKLMNNNPLSIYLETPKLKTVSGIFKEGDEYYIEMELSLEGYDSSFYEFIEKIDEKNVVSCHYNSNVWFNKQLPLKTIEQFYKSPIKINLNGKNPTMIFKIPTYKGKILLEVYNQQKKLINMNKLCINDEMIAIIKFSGLRFLKQQFIAEWEIYKIKLLKIIDEDNLPSGYFFSDETDVNIEPLEKQEKKQINENNIFFNLEEENINFINDNNINIEEPQPENTEEPQPVENIEEPQPNENTEEPQPNENTEEPQPNENTEEPQPENTEEPPVENTEEPPVENTEEPQVENTEEPQPNENTEEPPVENTEEPQSNENTEEPLNENDENEDISDENEDISDEYEFTDSEYELDLEDELDELTFTNKTDDIEKEEKIQLLLKAKKEQEEEIARIQKELENINK